MSNTGYIKRVPSDTYRTQHRGGKGIIGMETKEEDYVEHLFNADSHDLIFFFTDRGFMYWLNVYEIPEGSRTGKGKAIVNHDQGRARREDLRDADRLSGRVRRPEQIHRHGLAQGLHQEERACAVQEPAPRGLRALVIEEDDDLIGAGISENGNEILLSTRLGMACLFDQDDEQIRPMGRTARGVTGMRFKIDGDSVVSMEVIREHVYTEAEMTGEEGETETEVEVEVETDEEGPVFGSGPEVLVVTDGGMGKRSFVSTYRKTNRGAKGVVNTSCAKASMCLPSCR